MINLKTKILPYINSLPNDKILDMSEFQAFADDNLNVTKNAKICLW